MAKDINDFPTDDDEFIKPDGDTYLEEEDMEVLFDTEEVQKFEPLPVGTHAAIISDWKLKDSEGDKVAQMEVTFACTEGELKNRTTKVWYPRTGNRAFVSMNMMEALNIPRTEDGRHFRLKKSFFVGRPCYVIVEPNSYTDKKTGKLVETTQVRSVVEADEQAMVLAAEYL